MSLKIGIFVFIVCLVNCINSEGHYSIVGSKTLRPNTIYKVAVSSHDEVVQSTIKVKVTGLNGTVPYSVDKTIVVQPKSTELVELEIRNVNLTNCKLEAEGTAGLIFKNSTDLEFIGKSFSVYILTDKAAYKPGDKVMFRVIVLDANLLPAPHTKELNILITDAKQNQIKKWINEDTQKGVFSSELQLSESPLLGRWTINVTVMNTNYIKHINVEEYVLPDFEVIIETERYNTFNAGQIKASVRGKYTFGKLVEGEITVTAFATGFIGSTTPANKNAIVKKQISSRDGNLVEFDIKRELKAEEDDDEDDANDEYDQFAGVDIIITAIFVENLTGRKENATTTVSLHRSKYLINFISDSSGYKPGLPYEAWVKVTYHNGVPVQDVENNVIVKYVFDASTTIDRARIDENGLAKFKFDGQANFVPRSIKAKYLDATGSIMLNTRETRVRSDNQVFIQAKVKTSTNSPLSVDKQAIILVSSTQNMKSFTYIIIGRGGIIKTDTVMVPNRKYQSIVFMPTFAMVPKAHLIVYYVHTDGQIVYDSVELKLPSVFQNNIKVDLTAARSKPGKDIDINIKAKPHSFVGLLAVDQRVLLYKKGNDLSIDDIFGDLKHYESKVFHNFESFYEFMNTGTVILTNAKPPSTTKADEEGEEPIARVGSDMDEDIVIRKDFPETWIWETIADIGGTGRKTLHKKVPDTITSFILTGFAIDPEFGFGMIPIPKKLEVFQQFFITTRLPYSIKQGEIVTIPIIVFNYMNVGNVMARVTLDNEKLEFDFAELPAPAGIQNARSKDINIKENSGTATFFKIKPLKNGYITIKITAESEHFNDGIEKKLRVEPEGVIEYVDRTVLVDLRTKNTFNQNVVIDVPNTAVPDSTRIKLTVFGDIFGPTVKNIKHLIRLPTGCGEQTMITLVPNIVVLNYLNITTQLTPDIEKTALQYLTSGYQNELKYKQADGSFGTWANHPGSTWLTSYVIRYFSKASKFIYVEESIISKGLAWLSSKQLATGAFPEVGNVVHKEMQGEAEKGIALTAFALICFLENDKYTTTYAATITKAMDYINANVISTEDVYPLAIGAYALQLGKHPNRNTVLNKLKLKATTNGDTTFWSKRTINARLTGPNAVNVEITGYALLAYIAGNQAAEASKIVNWLAAQTNSQGGFASTQDTVVALQALGMYPAAALNPNYNVNVIAKHNGNEQITFDVNKNNAMVLQSSDVPSTTPEITVTATGSGIAMARVSYQYNVNGVLPRPRFILNTTINANTTDDFLHLTVCTSYIPEGADTFTSLAIIEVQLPSGYNADKNSFTHKKVQKYETKDDNTIVQMHFNKLDGTTVCPYVAAYKTFDVEKLKAAPVTVYDYYDNSRRARSFYKVKQACDVCENEICDDVCED